MQVFRNGRPVSRPIAACPRLIAPGVNFSDLPYRSGFDQRHHAAIVVAGVRSVAKLSGQPVPSGHFGCHAHFVDVAAHRFLAVDVFAHFHGHHADGDVCVVRRSHHNRVDVFLFHVEQPTEIVKSPCFGKPLIRRGRSLVVHIAERDNVFAADTDQILVPPAPRTDTGDIELFTRRSITRTSQDMSRYGHQSRQCGAGDRPPQEVSTFQAILT